MCKIKCYHKYLYIWIKFYYNFPPNKVNKEIISSISVFLGVFFIWALLRFHFS